MRTTRSSRPRACSSCWRGSSSPTRSSPSSSASRSSRSKTTLGLPPFDWNLFGISGSLNFTAGVLIWPFVFIMTDIINEYFGVRGVRLISWLAVGLIAYGSCSRTRHPPGARRVLGRRSTRNGRARHRGLRNRLRPGPVDDRRFDHRVPRRPAHRRQRSSTASARRPASARVVARDGIDGGLAAASTVSSCSTSPSCSGRSMADPAVPGRRHGKLRLQDGGGGGVESACCTCRAAGSSDSSGPTRRRG